MVNLEKELRDTQAYIQNAIDKVEVAIVEGKYFEEYQARKVPGHLTEQKILSEIAAHFRTQGFRILQFQFDSDSVSHSFLRIMWSDNPYTYPEERSVLAAFSSLLRAFSPKKKAPRSQLFGRAREAYQTVLENDVTTEAAADLLFPAIGSAVLGTGEPFRLPRKALRELLEPLAKGQEDVLARLNTRQLIDWSERQGYRVEVQRMFDFTFRPGGASGRR